MAHVRILQRVFAGGCPRDVTACTDSLRFRRWRSRASQDAAGSCARPAGRCCHSPLDSRCPREWGRTAARVSARGARRLPRPRDLQSGACSPPSDYDGAAAKRRPAATALARQDSAGKWTRATCHPQRLRCARERGARCFAALIVRQLARRFRGSAEHRGRAQPRASEISGHARRRAGEAAHRRATERAYLAGLEESRRRRVRVAGGIPGHVQAPAAGRCALAAIDPQCCAQPLR